MLGAEATGLAAARITRPFFLAAANTTFTGVVESVGGFIALVVALAAAAACRLPAICTGEAGAPTAVRRLFNPTGSGVPTLPGIEDADSCTRVPGLVDPPPSLLSIL